jgi:hypothetical protein
MAARTTKIKHDDQTRAKIKSAQIINRLMGHINGEVELSATQVSAGLGLLRKTIPDLSQAEIKSETTVRYVARVPEKKADAKAWQEQHAPKQPTIQ